MDILSDMNVTHQETPTVTPAQTKPMGSTKGEKKHENPKVTPTPTKDRQTPVIIPSSKDIQAIMLPRTTGIYDYQQLPMTQIRVLDGNNRPTTPNMEDETWAQDIEKVHNNTSKTVKLPLTQKMEDFTPYYKAYNKIAPYQSYKKFGGWLESQFPEVIPEGTDSFLEQLGIQSEGEIDYWLSLTAKDYMAKLGKEAYDDVRLTLAEIRTIRRYIHQQWDKDLNDPNIWSYLDYLAFREYYIIMDKDRFHELQEEENILPKEPERQPIDINNTDIYEESLFPPLPPYNPGLKKEKGIPLVGSRYKAQRPPQFWG